MTIQLRSSCQLDYRTTVLSYEVRGAETGKLLGWYVTPGSSPLMGDCVTLYALIKDFQCDGGVEELIARSESYRGLGCYKTGEADSVLAAIFAWQCIASTHNGTFNFEQMGIEVSWKWQLEFLYATGRFIVKPEMP